MENTFDGSFKFTNTSKEDFKVLWNNKEYTFPAESTCPMVIPGESLENIQEIRKKFALKWAQREFAKSKEWKAIEKEGNKHHTPATYNESILESYVQQCLNPLPLSATSVKDAPKKDIKFVDGGSVILGEQVSTGSLSASDGAFKDYTPPSFGKME
jgi:hypothetical protein